MSIIKLTLPKTQWRTLREVLHDAIEDLEEQRRDLTPAERRRRTLRLRDLRSTLATVEGTLPSWDALVR